ncbi:hypothetical protein ACN3E9_11265 [Vibrio pectenicida]|uniref:hypothetical protein n=1 Tax=Vibrio pectenicida TaxID=62763 RepID=UPI003B9D76B4
MKKNEVKKSNKLFWFGVIYTLLVPIFIAQHYEDPAMVQAFALSGAFITLLSKLNDIAELSFGPLKARMNDKINEATATIAQLNKLSVTLSDATLTDLMASNFMGGASIEKKLVIHDNIISTLNDIGIEPTEINQVEESWIKGISVIYVQIIQNHIEGRTKPSTININITEAQKLASQALKDMSDFSTWSVPTPQQIKNVIARHSISSVEASEWLDDYDHFLEHNEIRNKKRFVNPMV